ncbi:class I SAM-dependent methyltransferase [Helicobacter sp. MIT 99-10781]|uniref:class I SAM-dependent methyltransferase n=1 Tax=Helicobacter sp. MIT 99-10781 TaxID=1332285 RepID=UPI001C698EA0|nr:methyltransferase domain-containing protein [Helicobacter sp. MIT 99-10781]
MQNQNPTKHIGLPFEDASFEIVTMLAVLEHITHHIEMLSEIARVLTPGGIAILTMPSHLAKPVLEFLAYKLHVIDEAEIRDHKRYYDKADMREFVAQVPNLKITCHKYFQFGMNNFIKLTKAQS